MSILVDPKQISVVLKTRKEKKNWSSLNFEFCNLFSYFHFPPLLFWFPFFSPPFSFFSSFFPCLPFPGRSAEISSGGTLPPWLLCHWLHHFVPPPPKKSSLGTSRAVCFSKLQENFGWSVLTHSLVNVQSTCQDKQTRTHPHTHTPQQTDKQTNKHTKISKGLRKVMKKTA